MPRRKTLAMHCTRPRSGLRHPIVEGDGVPLDRKASRESGSTAHAEEFSRLDAAAGSDGAAVPNTPGPLACHSNVTSGYSARTEVLRASSNAKTTKAEHPGRPSAIQTPPSSVPITRAITTNTTESAIPAMRTPRDGNPRGTSWKVLAAGVGFCCGFDATIAADTLPTHVCSCSSPSWLRVSSQWPPHTIARSAATPNPLNVPVNWPMLCPAYSKSFVLFGNLGKLYKAKET